MDGEDRDEKHDNHRRGCEGNNGSEQDERPADELDDDRRPAKQIREGHADRVQHADESIGAASQFRIAMLDKAEPGDQPKRDRKPTLRNRERSKSEPPKERIERHTTCFAANTATVTGRRSSHFREEGGPRASPPRPRRLQRAGVRFRIWKSFDFAWKILEETLESPRNLLGFPLN
jgi:hypothetical protein